MVTERDAEQGEKAILEAYKQKRLEIFNRWPAVVAKRLNNYALGLQENYPDCDKYAMFKVLIGGDPSSCPKFDFPEPDSVAIFLDHLNREFPEKADRRRI